MIARRATRGSLWTAAGMVSSTLALLTANALVVAQGPTAVFADLVVLTMSVMVLSAVFRFGIDRVFVGEVHSTGAASGVDAAAARGAGLLAAAAVLGTVGALLLIAQVLTWPIDLALTHGLGTGERLLVAGWLLADVTRVVVAEAHRSEQHFRLAAACGYGLRNPLFVLFVLLAVLLPGDLERAHVVAAAAAASGVVLALAMVTISASFAWWGHPPLAALRASGRGNAAMLVTTLTGALVGASDVWIVGATTGPAETARYGFCVTLAAGIALLSTAVNGGLSPYLARALAASDPGPIVGLVHRYVRITSVAALVLYLGLLVLAEPVAVLLGGEDYRGLTPLIAILAAGQVLSTAAGLSGYVLTLGRRYSHVAAVTATVATVAILGEGVAGFGWGSAIGVAVVSGLATAALPIGNNIVSARVMGIRTDMLATHQKGRPRWAS